ncbi:GNAT family N-acetyltransferase [Conexibacter sp. W3-3-2]|uniref:GNAT family N-acetyltransferase n=1 Tax=Conexibacter sp. W3-3-2 TaxID=2675227 RepID=UPI001325D27C|nr:N-acetyltransferase family protein [Conexibacter sp. W3-3-2]MTD44570.1 GNAT family N-acetyltransferase [Conexibacter sp. W3-3-2]
MLRHADPGRDGAACAAIYRPYVEDGVASFELTAPDAGTMAARIRTCAASHAFLVAERGRGVVGFAYAAAHRERAAYRWSCDVSVYLDAAVHRQGVGRELYTGLLSLLRRQGLYRVHAGIALPNAASVGLHEAFGFRPVGTYAGVGYKHGAWRDVLWLQLDLRPDAPRTAAPAEPLGPQRLPGPSGNSEVADTSP